MKNDAEIMNPLQRRVARTAWCLVGCALSAALGACSLGLDRNGDQCKSDVDCLHFGGHPRCEEGVCISSGLGPEGCFFGTPSVQSEYMNACTVSECVPFDNCSRLGLCGIDGGALPNPVPPTASTAPPLAVNPVPVPTITCKDPSRPNIIYMTGSTSFTSLVKSVSAILSAGDPAYTIVWLSTSSCNGADSIFSTDPNKHLIKDVPPSATNAGNHAYFHAADGTKVPCLLSPEGDQVDVGESDIYASTCNAAYAPSSDIAGYLGPIQAITFVVPASSTQQSISAEAAHSVFGLGGAGGTVQPWVDPALLFIRGSGTGTVQLTSRVIDVPAKSWWGIDRLSADNLRDSMVGIDPTSAEKAIGVLSSDFADRARNNLRELYFQSFGQSCGYLPDSSPYSADKANVRDGHYLNWGPTHLYTRINNGVPSTVAAALVTRFSVPRIDTALLDGIISAGFVPNCAMKVSRTEEVGALSPKTISFECGCYFDFKTTGRSTCQACSVPADCPKDRPACNNGFCEQK